jgi:hypothetical protein
MYEKFDPFFLYSFNAYSFFIFEYILMKIVKRLQNCLHGYETTKKHWIVTFCIVFYGTEMTFIDFNPNEFWILTLKQV